MAKRKRKAIPDSVRFEVFKRDSFKCQYCGGSAPDVVLVVDHIEPHSKGGGDDVMNLISSCRDCNSGKSDRRLDDKSVIERQKAQLDELNERRSQLEMMIKWREGLSEIEDTTVAVFCREFSRRCVGRVLNDQGKRDASVLIRKFGLPKCLEALTAACDKYLRFDHDGNATAESSGMALRTVKVFAEPKEIQELHFLRAMLGKHLGEMIPWRDSLTLLKRAHATGRVTIDAMRSFILKCDSYEQWEDGVTQALKEAE